MANSGGQSFFEVEQALLVVLNVHEVLPTTLRIAAAIHQLLIIPLDDRRQNVRQRSLPAETES